jgi:regulator of sigma D
MNKGIYQSSGDRPIKKTFDCLNNNKRSENYCQVLIAYLSKSFKELLRVYETFVFKFESSKRLSLYHFNNLLI